MKTMLTRAFATSALLLSCAATFEGQGLPKQSFGKTPDGQEVFLYTLKNASGMVVTISNYGGTVTSIRTKDRSGKFADVVLGFDNVEGYTQKANTAYFGALIGRYGNRIAKGTFTLDGHTYHVPVNDGPNALHGGLSGFNKKIWDAKDVSVGGEPGLELHYLSRDGEEGFPGNLSVTVRYTLDAQNGLHIDYRATTDKDTVLNLTNHSYFNLAGAGSTSVLQHRLMLAADQYTPIDGTLIPTGAIESVAGTPLDFRKLTTIGTHINDKNDQLKYAKGYDHNFVLNSAGQAGTLAARVEEPTSGRVMEVFTTQPGVQFYTGNFLDGKMHGIGGVYRYRSALCLETQHFPDSPNKPKFPTAELHPGEQFHSSTIYRFSTQ